MKGKVEDLNTKVRPEDLISKVQEPIGTLLPKILKKVTDRAVEVKKAVIPEPQPRWKRFAKNHPTLVRVSAIATAVVILRNKAKTGRIQR